MANKEYLAALGDDYLKNNKMFSSLYAVPQVDLSGNYPQEQYLSKSRVGAQNVVDPASFMQDSTTTRSESVQSEHEFRMDTDSDYRDQIAFEAENQPLESSMLDPTFLAAKPIHALSGAAAKGANKVKKMVELDMKIADRSKRAEAYIKANPQLSETAASREFMLRNEDMTKPLLITPENSFTGMYRTLTKPNVNGEYNNVANTGLVTKPNGRNFVQKMFNVGPTDKALKVSRNSTIAQEIGGKNSHYQNFINKRDLPYMDGKQYGSMNYLRSQEEIAARGAQYKYIQRNMEKAYKDGDMKGVNQMSKQLEKMRDDYAYANQGFARQDDIQMLGKEGNQLNNYFRDGSNQGSVSLEQMPMHKTKWARKEDAETAKRNARNYLMYPSMAIGTGLGIKDFLDKDK